MDIVQSLGKMLVIIGIVLLVAGLALFFGGRIGIGRLPGDIIYKRGNFAFYFPLVSSILLSIFLTVLFNLLRFRR